MKRLVLVLLIVLGSVSIAVADTHCSAQWYDAAR